MTEAANVPSLPLLPPLVPPGEDAEDDDGHDDSDEEGEAETNRQEDPGLSLTCRRCLMRPQLQILSLLIIINVHKNLLSRGHVKHRLQVCLSLNHGAKSLLHYRSPVLVSVSLNIRYIVWKMSGLHVDMLWL